MSLIQSELLQLLTTFSVSEEKRFRELLQTTAFNSNKSVARFGEKLFQQRKSWASDSFTLKRCLILLYGSVNEWPESHIRDLMTRLYRQARRFLAMQQLDQDESLQFQLQAEQLRKRKLLKHHHSLVRKWSKHLSNRAIRDDEWHRSSFRLAEERELMVEQQDLRRPDDELENKVKALDAFYVSGKLKAMCEMVNRSRIFGKEYEDHLGKEIIQLLAQAPTHLQEACVQVYYHIYKTYESAKKKDYINLLKLIDDNHKEFGEQEARSLYRYAENFCIRKINKGEGEWLGQLFLIYRKLLENRLIIQQGKLPHTDYKNIVTVGLRLQENEWVLAFIENEKSQVESKIRDNAYTYNLANYFYETSNYDEVVSLLRTVEFTDVFYEISSKYILLKVYFDLEEDVLLSYSISSFDRYVRRNKSIAPSNRKAILNFLILLKRLHRIRQDSRSWRKEKLEKQLASWQEKADALRPVANLKWLLDKYNGFIGAN